MYRRRRREYVAATNALVAWLQSRLEDVDEIEAFVSGRAKEVRSVEQKLRNRDRLQPGRDSSYADLPDLIGIRVVVRLESEIAIVAKELHRLLVVDKDVDARHERSREETPGYRGRHFDVRARPDSRAPRAAHRPTCGDPGPDPRRGPVGLAGARAAGTRAATSCHRRAAGSSSWPQASWSSPSASSRTCAPGRWTPSSTQLGAAAAPSREAAAPLDEAALAEFLATRYTAAPSTPRRLGWMLELLREMNLDSTAALTSLLPASPDPRILALVEGRATVDTVRMLDDELLLVAPEAYIKANRAVPDERNPQRIRTLERRQRRLAAG